MGPGICVKGEFGSEASPSPLPHRGLPAYMPVTYACGIRGWGRDGGVSVPFMVCVAAVGLDVLVNLASQPEHWLVLGVVAMGHVTFIK